LGAEYLRDRVRLAVGEGKQLMIGHYLK